MQNGYLVADRFFDGADALRSAYDAHFAEPDKNTDRHIVWNYWHVPGLYTYLKTNPSKVLPEPLVTRFMQRLNAWAMATLGLSTRSHPWLSLYVNGCGQDLHNDSLNGQMGFVFSLTRWEGRNFHGGETHPVPPGQLLGDRPHRRLRRRGHIFSRRYRPASTGCSCSTTA